MQKNERLFTDGNLLRTFVEIADCGNLTLAATRLHRSQSAISVQIRNLEIELGTSLFLRDQKGMALSESGQKLLPAAKRIMHELSQVHSLFETPLNGKIRVGIPDDFDEGVLERTLAQFSQSNPGVEVVALSGCTVAFPDAIKKGQLDLAVVSGPDDVPGKPLRTQKPVWAACETMPLKSFDPVPLAVISHGCWMGELPKRSLEAHGREYNIAFECSGLLSLKAAIRAGFAIGILYESNVDSDMKTLSSKDGFPPLPSSKRTIIVGPEAPMDLANAMTLAIQRAV